MDTEMEAALDLANTVAPLQRAVVLAAEMVGATQNAVDTEWNYNGLDNHRKRVTMRVRRNGKVKKETNFNA